MIILCFKAPSSPSNLKYYLDQRDVTVTWGPPTTNRGPVTNYSISVHAVNPSMAVINETFIGLNKSFVFTADWNSNYQVKVSCRELSPPMVASLVYQELRLDVKNSWMKDLKAISRVICGAHLGCHCSMLFESSICMSVHRYIKTIFSISRFCKRP